MTYKYQDCAVCRGMRSFAFSGLGAGLGGLIAIFLEREKDEMIYWTLAGAMLFMVIMLGKKNNNKKIK